MQISQRRVVRKMVVGGLGVGLAVGAVPLAITPTIARADMTTAANDNLRTGWYPNSTSLSPSQVASGNFGQIFNATVSGSMYGQPVISQGTLLVATESNNVYGLDPVSGAQRWTRNLGSGWNPNDIGCGDITPTVGSTSTPVVDSATNTAYLTTKNYASGTAGPAIWQMHAVDVASGTERSGFPVEIKGNAYGNPGMTFDPTQQLQRPGLLLLGGVVYAGFGSHCDKKPSQGWVAGVSTAGRLTTLWTDETSGDGLAGIWAPGGGLVSDGPGQILLSTGNGAGAPAPTPGGNPPPTLGQAVVRLAVQSDGSLKATDFFSPFDYAKQNLCDCDLGSGNPLALPAPFGTTAHPHLLIQVGKSGYIYILDRDKLGGFAQGANGADAVLNRLGPFGGVWGKPSLWGGDGGYVYETTAAQGGKAGLLRAFKYGVDGVGNPTLSLVGSSSDAFGYSSSSPSISSNGTAGGSAVVWVVWRSSGASDGELRAYNAIPSGGTMTPIFTAAIGGATKFMSPVVDGNRVYIGTHDGHVIGFGSPTSVPLTGSPPNFPVTTVGQSATRSSAFTATADITVSSINSTGPFAVGATTPAIGSGGLALAKGATITVPITFTPAAPGPNDGTVTITTGSGSEVLGLSAEGQSATAELAESPPALSFGGVAVGSSSTLSATFTNQGAQPLTVGTVTTPAAPFSAIDVPQTGSTLAPGQSVSVNVTFAPTGAGSFGDALTINSDGGNASVALSGTAAAGGHLQITPPQIDYGNVSAASSATASFTVSNTGGVPLTITKSKPPASGVGFSAATSLPEGTSIAAGASVTESVVFAPTAAGAVSDGWILNSDDTGTGLQTVGFTGTGTASARPSVYVSNATVVRPPSGTATAGFMVSLGAVSASPVTVQWSTKDGTATTAGGDYVAVPATTLTFAPGQTSQPVNVTVNGAATHGPSKAFTIQLTNATNAVLGDKSGYGRIVNPVGLFSVYVGDPAVVQDPVAGSIAQFPVSLSAAPQAGEVVTVNVATTDGTATVADGDYNPLPSRTITFNSTTGATQNVPVAVNPAPAGEGNETSSLNLAAASANAQIGDAQGVVTIINGGPAPAPSMSVSDVSLLEPTGGTATAVFTVQLSSPSPTPVTARMVTKDGTALVSRNDYVPISNTTLTFAPGQTSASVSVTVNANAFHEVDHNFTLHLYNAVNATLADADGLATLINPASLFWIYASDVSVVQNHTGGAFAPVTISLSAAPLNGEPVTVKVATKDGSATVAGGDYTAVPLTAVTFAAGQLTALVDVPISADAAADGAEGLTLNLSAQSANVGIGDAQAAVSILSHS